MTKRDAVALLGEFQRAGQSRLRIEPTWPRDPDGDQSIVGQMLVGDMFERTVIESVGYGHQVLRGMTRKG